MAEGRGGKERKGKDNRQILTSPPSQGVNSGHTSKTISKLVVSSNFIPHFCWYERPVFGNILIIPVLLKLILGDWLVEFIKFNDGVSIS